jgi:hypothetical protein
MNGAQGIYGSHMYIQHRGFCWCTQPGVRPWPQVSRSLFFWNVHFRMKEIIPRASHRWKKTNITHENLIWYVAGGFDFCSKKLFVKERKKWTEEKAGPEFLILLPIKMFCASGTLKRVWVNNVMEGKCYSNPIYLKRNYVIKNRHLCKCLQQGPLWKKQNSLILICFIQMYEIKMSRFFLFGKM